MNFPIPVFGRVWEDLFTMAVIEAPQQPSSPPPRRRKPRRRSRLLTILGLALVLTGIGFIAYVGWELYGTNIVAAQKQEEVKEQISEDWANNIDSNAIGLLRVDRWGSDYEMPIIPGSDLLDSKGRSALASGVGWYEKGVGPGEVGNFVIAGHRSGRGAVFKRLPDLRAGDTVEIETRTHLYTYKLRMNGDEIKVDYTTAWPLFPVPDPNARGATPTDPILTMITCAEMFHTDNRRVVIGDLVDVVEKPAVQAAPAAP